MSYLWFLCSTACNIRAVHYFYLLLLGLLFSINGTRPGVLNNIYLGKPEILVGKSNGWRNSVWEASENNYGTWSVIWGDAIFPLFLVFSANLEILRSGSFSKQVKFDSFMLMHKISTWMVLCRHPTTCHTLKWKSRSLLKTKIILLFHLQ